MKKIKITPKILNYASFFLFIVAISIPFIVGETYIFGQAGMIRYSWIMWFFLPIGIFLIVISSRLKKENKKYKVSFIIAFICTICIAVFGSERFIFQGMFSYDPNRMITIKNKTKLDLPNEVKIVTEKNIDCYISYVKITNRESKENFNAYIQDNFFWKTELSSKIRTLLPIYIQSEVTRFDYYVFCNITNGEYNTYPVKDGKYECVLVAYDFKRLMILDRYTISLN